MDDLMVKFKSIYTEKQRDSFEAEWRLFFHTLTGEEQKTAIYAFFDGVHESSQAFNKSILQWVENGGEEERLKAIAMTNEMLAHPLFASRMLEAS